jgi:methanogenic corrinoid protein MtbC1
MISEVYFLDFYNNLIDGNKAGCSAIVEELLSKKTGLKNIYVELFQRSLYRIGGQWEKEKIPVAVEHHTTGIIEFLIQKFSPDISNITLKNKTALISCIDKEYHAIASKMISNIFELNGWNTVNLGASTPTREIIGYIKIKSPDIVALSFNFYLNLLRFQEVAAKIRKEFPGIKLIAGGQGLKELRQSETSEDKNIIYLKDVLELDSFLKTY